jgi:hypothetical protein
MTDIFYMELETINENKNENYNYDTFIEWSYKSMDVPFRTNKKCVGNGEEKLAKELNISSVGGQNSIIDLVHPVIGNISVKDMTNDDCILGTEGSNNMRVIFREIINLFICWIIKYKSSCILAEKFYNDINNNYGSSKISILNGIDRLELSSSNLLKLNLILNELKNYKLLQSSYVSLQSEYINDILYKLGDKSLQELLNECIRKEATDMTLIIVHESKGWCIVKDINKLTCPRITRGSPRINYN